MTLFYPRPQLDFVPLKPLNNYPSYEGVAAYVQKFEDPRVTPQPGPSPGVETRAQIKERKRKLKWQKEMQRIEELMKTWDPHNNPKATEEAYKTLFVGRLSYTSTEESLRREFEEYGPIKTVRIVVDLDGKPRGYGFIEFEREKDMRTAYKDADGKRVDGRRIVVDVERGRTVKDWRPRRLGGGLGGSRLGGDDVNVKSSGRFNPSDRRREDESKERPRERSRERDREYRDRERDRYRERDGGDRGRPNDRGGRDGGGRDDRRGDRDGRPSDRYREQGGDRGRRDDRSHRY